MKTLIAVLCFCLLAIACKKTETNKPIVTPTPKSMEELLTDARWVLVRVYSTALDTHTHDTVRGDWQLHPCSLDDTVYFTPVTKKRVWHVGKERCSEPFVVDSNSSWELTGNVVKTFGGFVGDVDYTIERLTADSLIWHYGHIGYSTSQTTMTYLDRK
ncbi:hypothetical protein [Polluticoccus soli]|uniref:hypothetical protein n=1 Tax=Polluticoccus soli TaxID=3034150 RepID=UPI0023E303B0|nr:hypothetical protein [Flavipsychrobacter sp. JY13-12]